MQTAFKFNTHILPGHRIEIVVPELAVGQAVEVFTILPDTSGSPVPIAADGVPAEQPKDE